MSTPAALPDAARLLADLIAGVFPDARGRFGPFGGRYVPETLIPALERLERGVREHLHERSFQAQFSEQLTSWVGAHGAHVAGRLSARWGAHCGSSARIWRTPVRTRSTMRSARRCSRSGSAPAHRCRDRAGQHGVASAAACARLGLPCTCTWVDRHGAPGPQRGTHAPVGRRGRARDHRRSHAARRHRRGAARLGVGSARDLLSARLGRGTAPVSLSGARAAVGDRPRSPRADARRNGCSAGCSHRLCRGGSNSMGAFHAFIPDTTVEIIGVEAGGRGAGLGDNAATVAFGRPGVLHGTYSMLLQNADGQIQETHSVSAGLDYPASARSTRCCRPWDAFTTRPRATRRRWPGCAP